MFLEMAVNKIFAKLKGKNLIRIKVEILHRIFSSFPKRFTTAVFKSKCRHNIIKNFNIRTNRSKVLCGKTDLARFVKIRGKHQS